MRIVVLDGYTLNPGDNPWDEIEELGDLTVYDRTRSDEILERSRDAEIILTNKVPLAAETLEQLPKLRFVSVLATGYNVVDVEAARAKGIPVSNVPTYATDAVAQFVFALLLQLCHRIGIHNNAVKNGRWSECADYCFWDTQLVELQNKQIGIVGFGKIGRRVGELAHAFGMKVVAYDVAAQKEPEYEPFEWASIKEVFATSDVVSLHCPLTDQSKGMVNRELLSLMKGTAFLINTARGPLVNEQDLVDALNNEHIAGAAVDVVALEPIAPSNPLLAARNCVITPHIAWATLDARRRLMHVTAENIKAFLAGTPARVVNPPD